MTEPQAGAVDANFSADKISERLEQIRQSIPQTVRLVAVSKQMPVAAIRAAYAAGVRDFAENRLQEALPKQQELQDLPHISWHFIGHLQSNKVAKALDHFQWIHSVDSLKLTQQLNQLCEGRSSPPNLLLQVKMLPDANKYGWLPEELLANLPHLEECTYLKIVGLMTILPFGLSDEENFSAFTRTRELAHRIAQKVRQQNCNHLQMQHLSMGMSGDYRQAVKAGATMIRLGQILFGSRLTH